MSITGVNQDNAALPPQSPLIQGQRLSQLGKQVWRTGEGWRALGFEDILLEKLVPAGVNASYAAANPSALSPAGALGEETIINRVKAPEVPEGVSRVGDMVYFRAKEYVAGIDLARGGALTELYSGDEQLLCGNGLWMHSSPEGAADGSGLGYDMAANAMPSVSIQGDSVVVEGRLSQSNGSGEYAGHRYRRTYNFDQQGSFEVNNEMWVDAGDVAAASEQFGRDPSRFYVWANPLDANLPNYYWNAEGSWQGVANQWTYQPYAQSQGVVPNRPAGQSNWGLTSLPEMMQGQPTAALYRPGGPAIVRQVTGGDLAQVNLWRNAAGHTDRTMEFSSIAGDRRYLDSGYDIPDALTGGESYRYSERISVGRAADLIPGQANAGAASGAYAGNAKSAASAYFANSPLRPIASLSA